MANVTGADAPQSVTTGDSREDSPCDPGEGDSRPLLTDDATTAPGNSLMNWTGGGSAPTGSDADDDLDDGLIDFPDDETLPNATNGFASFPGGNGSEVSTAAFSLGHENDFRDDFAFSGYTDAALSGLDNHNPWRKSGLFGTLWDDQRSSDDWFDWNPL